MQYSRLTRTRLKCRTLTICNLNEIHKFQDSLKITETENRGRKRAGNQLRRRNTDKYKKYRPLLKSKLFFKTCLTNVITKFHKIHPLSKLCL